MTNVLIIQKAIKHYRIPFYERLYELLNQKGIKLTVAYSQLNSASIKSKKDNANLPSLYAKEIPSWSAISGSLVFQFAIQDIHKADLVIVEQANKNLINNYLLIRKLLGKGQFAYWGHGKNLQEGKKTIKEAFKKSLLKAPSWWFAYTQTTKEYLIESGFPSQRITNVNNSIDTQDFLKQIEGLSHKDEQSFKDKLNIGSDSHTLLFCGSIYDKKLLPFLYNSCIKIREQGLPISLIIIGAGPDESWAKNLSNSESWIYYLGPKFGLEKAIAFKSADLIVNPGLVGLGVLDALASGTPMITTDYPFHSPEISYLQDNVNGLITKFNEDDYSKQIIELLNDKPRLKSLSEQALLSSSQYTIETMAQNFASGVANALNLND